MVFKKQKLFHLLCMFFILVYQVEIILGKTSVISTRRVDNNIKGHANNPSWSLNSKLLAYELTEASGSVKVMVHDLRSTETDPLLSRSQAQHSIYFDYTDNNITQMPIWSRVYESDLVFLLSNEHFRRRLKKVEIIRQQKGQEENAK